MPFSLRALASIFNADNRPVAIRHRLTQQSGSFSMLGFRPPRYSTDTAFSLHTLGFPLLCSHDYRSCTHLATHLDSVHCTQLVLRRSPRQPLQYNTKQAAIPTGRCPVSEGTFHLYIL